jgi:hypothetical protein
MLTLFRLCLILIAAAILPAQTPMTNDTVIKMVKAGLSDDIVLGSIRNQPPGFSVEPEDLIALKKAGVSDKVVAAIVEKAMAAPAAPAPAAPVSPPAAPAAAPTGNPLAKAPLPTEIGVYYLKDGAWKELPPEVVNVKTGGILKTIGTAGIVKGDVNGHINGTHSANKLANPVELLVYAPEGTAITEYQLLRLREQKNSREFRTMTGGVLHQSGGATRDLVQFEGRKIAPRTFQITMPGLGPGDYGLLPPASADPNASSGRIGKIFSFWIIE